jgi:hypothetical protein
MKKIAFILLAASLLGQVAAQNVTDVIYMNPTVQMGTPRFLATAGAFTALGNDFSGVHLNPAGLAVFRHNEIGLALGAGGSTVTSTFYGNTMLNNWTNFIFANIGYTKRMTTNDPDITWNFGITYNRNSHANSEAQSDGINPESTILEDWINNASGIAPDDLASSGLLYESLGYQAYLLEADVENNYFTEAQLSETRQFFTERVNAHFDELGISVAVDNSEKLYLGGSLNIPFYKYAVDYFYQESGYGGDSIRGMEMLETFSNSGIGFNLKFGAIYRPIPNLRLGASIFTPTWMSVTQEYEVEVTGNFVNSESITAKAEFDPFVYSMRTAPQTNLGIAYVFGQNGFISVDYNFVPLRWSGTSTPDLSYLKQDIKDLLNNQHTFRIGAEIRLVNVYLRGGYSFLTDPYASEVQDASRKTYNMGIGYRANKFTFDIGYSIQNEDFQFYPYSQNVQPAQQSITRKPFVASLSLRL